MECERCGKERFVNQVHVPRIWLDVPVWELIARMNHEGCGGGPKVVELLDAIEGREAAPDQADGMTRDRR